MSDPHPTPPAPASSALSALASSFLHRPLNPFGQHLPHDALHPHTDDDDDDDEPLFYSSHPSRPTAGGPSASHQHTHHPPASSKTPAGNSTDTLPRLFPSTDSLAQDDASVRGSRIADGESESVGMGSAGFGAGASLLFDRTQEAERQQQQPAGHDELEDDSIFGGAASSIGLGRYSSRADEEASERQGLVTGADDDTRHRPTPAPAPARVPSVGGRGWLAHQSAYPTSSTAPGVGGSGRGRAARSDSTSSYDSDISSSTASTSSSTGSSSLAPSENDEDGPTLTHTHSGRTHAHVPPPRAPEPLSESRFLGRGDWRKYHDPLPLSAFLLSCTALVAFAPFTLSFSRPSTPSGDGSQATATPFRTLLHALPLLSLLLALASLAPPALLLALRRSVRYALLGATAVGVLGLGAVGWMGFVGSFEGEGWWSTIGLRLLSIPPLICAGLFARNLWLRRTSAERTVQVVELACDVLLAHPPLLLLSPALMLAFGLASGVFLTVWSRLFLLGWYETPAQDTYHYHLKSYAVWLLILVGALWVWTWNVVRGVRRVVVAGVIGEWYFHRHENANRPAEPDPFNLGLDVADVRVAWDRATGRSLGSICLGAAVSGCLQGLKWGSDALRRATSPTTLAALPPVFGFLQAAHPLTLLVVSALEQVNNCVLVYVGVSGKPFAESCRGVAGLVKRRGRVLGRRIMDYTMLKTILSLISLAVSCAGALVGYFFTIHALGNEGHAPIVSLLCGATIWTTVRFGVDALGDAADALFICFAIDEENGGGRCEEAKLAFGGPKRGPMREV